MPDKLHLSIRERLSMRRAYFSSTEAMRDRRLSKQFRRNRRALTVPAYKELFCFTMRRWTSRLSIRQLQHLAESSPTIDIYKKFAKSVEYRPPNVVNIGDETLAFCFGSRSADKVVVWFPGFGYVLNPSKAHMMLGWDLFTGAEDARKRLAVFILQYDLAFHAPYPRQLTQATTAVRYLIEVVGFKPSQIIVAGDCSGGHLVLSLISHILHPNPLIPGPPLRIKEPFSGVALISPWVTFDQRAESVERNADKDMFPPKSLKEWSTVFMGDASRDNYNFPLDAPPDWWASFPASSILVLGGENELHVDDITGFVHKLKVHNASKTASIITKGECHDAPLIDRLVKRDMGTQSQLLHAWVLRQPTLHPYRQALKIPSKRRFTVGPPPYPGDIDIYLAEARLLSQTRT